MPIRNEINGMGSRPSPSIKSETSCLGLCQLMSNNEDEIAVHGWHCRGDMVMRMRNVMVIERSWCQCRKWYWRLPCLQSGSLVLNPENIFAAIAPRKVSLHEGYWFFSFAPFVVTIPSDRSKANVKIMTGSCTCRCYTQMHQRLLFLTRGAAKILPELAQTGEPARRLEATSWPFKSVAEDLNKKKTKQKTNKFYWKLENN